MTEFEASIDTLKDLNSHYEKLIEEVALYREACEPLMRTCQNNQGLYNISEFFTKLTKIIKETK